MIPNGASIDNILKEMSSRQKTIYKMPGNSTLTRVPQISNKQEGVCQNISGRTILPKGGQSVPSQSSSIPPNVTFLNSPWMPWNQSVSNASVTPPNVTASNFSRSTPHNPTVVQRVFDQHFYNQSPIIQNYQSLSSAASLMSSAAPLVTSQSERMAVSNRMMNNQNQFLSSGLNGVSNQMFPSLEHSYANNMFPAAEHTYANSVMNPKLSSDLSHKPRYGSSRRTDGVPLFDDPTLPPGWTR